MSDFGHSIYGFGEFRLDPVKRRLLDRKGSPIALTSKVLDTLVYLLVNRGRIIGKEELMSAIWTDTIVEENNLSQNISTLRRLLGEQPGDHRFIVTVPGKGFKFVADVQELSNNGDISPHPAEEDLHPPRVGRIGERPSIDKMPGIWLSSLAAIAVIASLSYLGFVSYRDYSAQETPITSIAVLPFFNAGGDPGTEYLSDGVSESLIDRLSELPQLKVIARSSSFKYRGENVDPQDAANKLGVQAIVTGRVVLRGDDLSVRVELIDARDNNQLWGAEFNRKSADALTIQREIAHSVSEKLRVKLSGEQEQEIAKQYTVNPQAYELLLRGRFEWAKGGKAENHRKAVEYFMQAIAADPKYALAFADLSLSYSICIGIADPNECWPKAERAARTALELDERLAEAHHSMANVKLNAWDWAGAESEYLRALELNPNLARAHAGYSNYLTVIGRHDQAIVESKKARELDPLLPRSNVQFAWTLMLAGQYDEAIEIFKKNDMKRHENLGFAYSRKAMYREAAAEFEEAIKSDGSTSTRQIYLGASLAKARESKRARAILRQMETTESFVSPTELACLYAALGENEKAFASLEKAFIAHDLQLQTLNIESFFDSIRDDPRFQDLVRRVGLPQ